MMKQIQRRHKIWVITALFLALVAGILSFPMNTFAKNHIRQFPQKVKVGYIYLNGFFCENQGEFSGLGYEYLQEIATYTGWEYEFKSASLEECLQMLGTGEIDLFVPVQKIESRLNQYEYSAEPFCVNQSVLIAGTDTQYGYNDFQAFEGMDIGIIKANVNGQRLKDYLTFNGCTANYVEYDTQEQMEQALSEKRIDAVLLSSNRGLSDCRIIASLPVVDSYIISTKGNRAVMDGIDYAQEQIAINTPNMKNDLQEKYRKLHTNLYPALNKEELDYIQQKQSVDLFVGPGDYDVNIQKTRGMTSRLVERLEQLTGLEIHVSTDTSLAKVYERFTNGEGDLLISMNRDYGWAEQHNTWLSRSYVELSNVFITNGHQSQIQRVVVTEGSYMEYALRKSGKYELVLCKANEKAVDKVLYGEADAAYCSEQVGNYYAQMPKYKNLVFTSTHDFETGYSMGISKNSDIILVSIINKTLGCISEQELDAMKSGNGLNYEYTLEDYFYANPWKSSVIIAMIASVCALLLAFFVFALKMKKKNQELLNANNAKSSFLSRMSHEMRTPLSTIIGLNEIEAKNMSNTEVVADCNRKTQVASKHLLQLINDVLDMTKISQGKVILRSHCFNIQELVDNIATVYEADAQRYQVDFQIEIPENRGVNINGDQLRLKQVIINLVSNAMKYNKENGWVLLRIEELANTSENPIDESAESKGKVTYRFSVSDSGKGISEEDLKVIFRAFERGMNTGNAGGTGLGLAISQSIVNLMGGELQVTSTLNEGSTFWFDLTFDKSAEGQTYTQAMMQQNKTVDLSHIHILVTEDNEINRSIIVTMLQEVHAEVTEARDGQEACRIFEQSEEGYYDVILMDIMMPNMDGYAATQYIRALNRSDAHTTLILALSANAYDDDIAKSKAAGMDEHFSKPVNMSKLFAYFDSHCRQRE